MIDISKASNEQKSHFLYLVMSPTGCWHKWGEFPTGFKGTCFFKCVVCGERYLIPNPDYFNNLNGFGIVKNWFEKNQSKLWKEYIKSIADCVWPALRIFNDQLDLNNLITFLLRPTQIEKWGWVGTHKLKHPALTYWEGL